MKIPNLGGDKQNPIVMIVLIVVILVAVFLVARNFVGGGGEEYLPPEGGTVQPLTPGPPPGAMGPPGGPPGASPAAGPPAPNMPTGPPAGPPTGAPPAGPSAPTQPAPVAPATGAAPLAPTPPTPAQTAPPPKADAGMQAMTVFGSVVVNYPKGWGLKASGPRDKAVFTDSTAFFEVHPPDPKATTAKAIAQAALDKSAKGGTILKQAADKVSDFDVYWFAVNHKGNTMRIVGIDGPTRIAVVAYTKSALFAKYRDTFNKMQSEIRFAK